MVSVTSRFWSTVEPLTALSFLPIAGLVTALAIILPAWIVLFAILLALLFAPPILDLVSGRLDIMEAKNVIIGYWFLDFGLGIVNDVFLDQREIVEIAEFKRMLPEALACVDVSILLFYVGYYSPIGSWFAAACPRISPNWKSSRVNVVVALTAATGIIAYVRFVADQGGLASMFTGEMQLAASQLGEYYLVLAAFRLPLIAALISYLWARITGNTSHKIASIFLIAATFLMAASMGARGAPLRTVLACSAAAYYIPPRRRLSRTIRVSLVTVILVALVIIIPLQTALRVGGYFPGLSTSQVLSEASHTAEATDAGLFLKMFVTRFMAYEELERIIERTGTNVEPQAGKTFLEIFYGFVPRSLWPEKPGGQPLISGQIFLDNTAAGVLYWFPTITWPGELYWNFLWPGIIFGMIVTGIFCRGVYAYFKSNSNISGVLFYIPMLLFFEVFAIGGFGAVTVTSLVMFGPILFAYLALTI